MSNKENQSKKVKVNGKWIEVSEEVYRAYMRDKWREAQREYRSKKCRNADGTVCRKDCKTCPHYLEGEGLTGAMLSLDAFVTEDGSPVEFADKRVDVELEVARNILKEAVEKAKLQLTDRERLILKYFMDERSDTEIGEALHISKSGARKARSKLFAKLKALLSDFADYFKK